MKKFCVFSILLFINISIHCRQAEDMSGIGYLQTFGEQLLTSVHQSLGEAIKSKYITLNEGTTIMFSKGYGFNVSGRGIITNITGAPLDATKRYLSLPTAPNSVLGSVAFMIGHEGDPTMLSVPCGVNPSFLDWCIMTVGSHYEATVHYTVSEPVNSRRRPLPNGTCLLSFSVDKNDNSIINYNIDGCSHGNIFSQTITGSVHLTTKNEPIIWDCNFTSACFVCAGKGGWSSCG